MRESCEATYPAGKLSRIGVHSSCVFWCGYYPQGARFSAEGAVFGRTKQRPPVATNTSPRGYPPAALALIVPEAEEPSPLLGEHPKGARLSTEDVLPTAFVPVATQAAPHPLHWGTGDSLL